MIVTELTVACLLFLWGAASGILASILNVFGRASVPARCVADVLIAFSTAAAYFFGLFLAASGEFRAYSLAAFVAGVAVSAGLCARWYPALRRLGKRVLFPVLSLEKKMEKKVAGAFSPICERLRIKRDERIAKRDARKREIRERKETEREKKKRLAEARRKEILRERAKTRRKRKSKRARAPASRAKERAAAPLLRRQRN